MNILSQIKNKAKLLLVLMIGYDFSLHLVTFFKVTSIHPLYPVFPLFNQCVSYVYLPMICTKISYDVFWTTYWGMGFMLALIILFSE